MVGRPEGATAGGGGHRYKTTRDTGRLQAASGDHLHLVAALQVNKPKRPLQHRTRAGLKCRQRQLGGSWRTRTKWREARCQGTAPVRQMN